ncbi:signal peptide peptidase SppA [Prevotella nigrescens]|jgi:signal peptide peptidase sppA, 67K type|uniref:Signal peptide peptidase SppA, 67K type n=1 Tax=Prevotella nigrescens CC14M TaxID=1073366 RepID=V8CQ54_9BACT|nr:signal peptide peptidase SppA [Prevotella nigrescens]ELX67086.1 signal peptide peptidase SppA, 67K type [Prevotella nigrescens F0103]ETD28896.1 signal peptide peptidase SppA, 67K type [Prevotella nigrescens CC14M]QUB54908.1 signal peptide peptidase SppA [Prevotella nigrescens F0103]
MKDFFKNVFATFVGLFLFVLVTLLLGFVCIFGMVLSSESTTEIKNNSVLVINLSGPLNERTEENVITKFVGKTANETSLEDVLSGIEKAKADKNIKGIYLEAGVFVPNSYAALQEIRDALIDFKKSNKWIVAYGDSYTQGTYYLASVANDVYLNPQGMLDWHGLSTQRIYLKDMLAKFGVKVQVSKVGTYKSATEMFTGDKMSDADRQQTSAYLNGIWKYLLKGVGESRNIPIAKLNEYADSVITFANPADYLKMKLIDKLLYTDQVRNEIKKRLGIASGDDINQVSLADLKTVKADKNGNEIAVYYAYGDIVDAPVSGTSLSQHNIVGKDVCKDLKELMDDDDVKAVVIRVNSGGGSAFASEQMWHQIMELKKVKPVVVSMGGYAASGGYYMSVPANWIVAEPTTITGSIGIFGMFPDFSGLASEKLGIKFDEVKTNKNGTFLSPMRPLTPDEMRMLQVYIDRGYNTFKDRVAQGRKLTMQQVETIAQGHVYTGEDALKIKLVDELGGLDKAVLKAVQLAKIKDYYTKNYPAPVNWLDQIFGDYVQDNYLSEQLHSSLGMLYQPFSILRTLNQQSAIQARIPYFININ